MNNIDFELLAQLLGAISSTIGLLDQIMDLAKKKKRKKE